MGASRLNFRAILLFGLGLAFAAAVAARESTSAPASRASLSLDELSEKLQVVPLPYRPIPPHNSNTKHQTCSVVQDLNAEKLQSASETSTLASQIFAVLFPSSPAINALLATLYISGPPNFLLALCPPNIDPSSLSVMVAFAVGGLLGDTLFHLLPEIFLGEDSPEHVRFVLVEPNRNLLLGVAIMVGFMTFVAMDKGLRIATGGEGHEHSHGGHEHGVPAQDKAVSSSVKVANGEVSQRRKGEKGAVEVPKQDAEKEISASVKLGGYLNLM